MFEKILSNKLEASCLLFIDVGSSSCRQLLLSYMQHRLQQQARVTFVPSGQSAAELPGHALLDCRPLCGPDPEPEPEREPGQDREPDGEPDLWLSADRLRERLWAAAPAAGPPARLMVIEDASCLLHWLGVSEICRLIQHVKRRGHQLVLCVGEEAAGEEWVAQLRHYATQTVTVDGCGTDLVTDTTCRLKTGKVETAVERVSISPALHISKVEPYRAAPSVAARPAPPTDQLAPGLTTFSLQLSEAEKQSRSQLVLPYLRPEQQGGGESTPGSGTGQIFYQPDAADDWDEEDPDDDLDI